MTMRRILTVTTAATTLALLTIDEMREAAGVTGSGQDLALTKLGLRIAANIAAECNVAVASGGVPTLMQETLKETFFNVRLLNLRLSRRHNVEIIEVIQDGVTLAPDAVLAAGGDSNVIFRLANGNPTGWCANNLIVSYKAGFVDAPGDLKQAAMDFFRSTYLKASRDPMVRSEHTIVPGVLETENQYWVGSVPGQSSEGPVPEVVSGQLKRFRNLTIG